MSLVSATMASSSTATTASSFATTAATASTTAPRQGGRQRRLEHALAVEPAATRREAAGAGCTPSREGLSVASLESAIARTGGEGGRSGCVVRRETPLV